MNIIQSLRFRYYKLRSFDTVRRVLTRRARDSWERLIKPAKLSSAQARIAADLKRDGIALSSLAELVPERAEEILRYAREFYERPEIGRELLSRESSAIASKMELIFHLYGSYGEVTYPLETHNPLVQGILDERILLPAAAYLGYVPTFIMHSLHSTILVPPSSGEVFSQRWHRDPEDRTMIKVFLYASDVLEKETGPFTYIKGSHEGGVWRNLYPQIPPVGSYPPAGEPEKRVPPTDIFAALGKAGTLVFCDTSGLHKGGYSTKTRRLMYAATFASLAATTKTRFRRSPATSESTLGPIGREVVRTIP